MLLSRNRQISNELTFCFVATILKSIVFMCKCIVTAYKMEIQLYDVFCKRLLNRKFLVITLDLSTLKVLAIKLVTFQYSFQQKGNETQMQAIVRLFDTHKIKNLKALISVLCILLIFYYDHVFYTIYEFSSVDLILAR